MDPSPLEVCGLTAGAVSPTLAGLGAAFRVALWCDDATPCKGWGYASCTVELGYHPNAVRGALPGGGVTGRLLEPGMT